jgi:hypothetical protein
VKNGQIKFWGKKMQFENFDREKIRQESRQDFQEIMTLISELRQKIPEQLNSYEVQTAS